MAGRKFIIKESSLKAIMKNGLDERIDEGVLQNIGKGIGKAALYGAIGAGSIAAVDKGLENQENYEQSINAQAARNQQGSDGEFAIQKFLMDNHLDDTPENRQLALQHIKSLGESRIDRIVSETINRILKA